MSEIQRRRDVGRSLQQHIETARLNLQDTGQDGLLYIGNPHVIVPKALLYDSQLDVADKLCWQIVRDRIGDGSRPLNFPDHDELGRHMSRARAAVGTAMQMLRASRWMVKCGQARNHHGRYASAIYLITDEKLALADVLELDQDYLDTLRQLQQSSTPRLAELCTTVLSEIDATIAGGHKAESVRPTTLIAEVRDLLNSESDCAST